MRATSSVCRGFNLMRTGDEDTQHEPSQPHPIPRPPKCRSMIRIIVRLSNAIISQMLHHIRPRESKLNQGQSSSRLAYVEEKWTTAIDARPRLMTAGAGSNRSPTSSGRLQESLARRLVSPHLQAYYRLLRIRPRGA